MKKYVPSVKNNNELKNEIVTELQAYVYKLEKGKFDSGLDKDSVKAMAEQLKNMYTSFDETLGTGDENIGVLYDIAISQIKHLKKQSEQSLIHRFESAFDELSYTIGLWKDVLDGKTVMETPEDVEKERVSGTKKRLNSRLSELETIKNEFVANGKRIEEDIASFEKDLNAYESAMLEEDNERKINDLYREIKAVKSKIDMLSVRKNNYSACYNLLDMIYANAREILQSTEYAADEIAKAKVLLNIDSLKKVIVDPDKAINILKQMDKDIKDISARTVNMDQKVFGLNAGVATVSDDALKYKEELMRKKREKEGLNKEIAEISINDNQQEIKTENE